MSDVESYEQQLDDRWYQVETYNDLLKLNIEYISGKLKMTPYHFGPLVSNVPSSNLVNNLIKLHGYGILTVSGQESMCKCEIKKDDGWYSIEQRGYLCFHINIEDNLELAKSLIKQFEQINQQKDKTIIYNVFNIKNGDHITNISEEDKCFNVTRVYNTKHKEISWNDCTNLWFESNYDSGLWGNEVPKIYEILENTIYFDVTLPEYGKGNLEEILLDMSKNA
jgi:hypothetical protein